MAGDWMKIEKSTPDKPEVFAMAEALGIDPDLVCGKLFRVWAWFDSHTTDGNAIGVTFSLLDRIAGVTEFAKTMQKVGWLTQKDGCISIPNFTNHNGKSAKTRSETARRVSDFRANSSVVTDLKQECNGEIVTSALAREEKRRVYTPLPPRGGLEVRISKMFSRKDSTFFSAKEVKAMRSAMPIETSDLELVERYYAAQRAKGREGIHRRDLLTFLNNYRGELDRARAWAGPAPKPEQSSEVDDKQWREFLASIPYNYIPHQFALSYLKTDFREWRKSR